MKSSSFGHKGFKLHTAQKEILWALQPTTVITDFPQVQEEFQVREVLRSQQVQVREVSRSERLCNKSQHCNLPIYFLISFFFSIS